MWEACLPVCESASSSLRKGFLQDPGSGLSLGFFDESVFQPVGVGVLTTFC